MKYIRFLESKDAVNMFNCLSDKDNLKYLTLGYKDYSLDDCALFVKQQKENTINFAVVDDNDEWSGTISLKNIDKVNKKAEFAIITDKRIQGKGITGKAAKEVIRYAFDNLYLNKVFLNVVSDNTRAIGFYNKIGFSYIGESRNSVLLGNTFYNLKWFELLKEDFNE